ncbi:MARVEL domain-containing protein 3 isoform X3 [Pyxicephalus adspersus]|uniref:MARVEL domain-containing protein 3 isoform X3 n=1 Tax=Pyxicephalus adspersus TaxID=30357 RepID=UPI003B5C8256
MVKTITGVTLIPYLKKVTQVSEVWTFYWNDLRSAHALEEQCSSLRTAHGAVSCSWHSEDLGKAWTGPIMVDSRPYPSDGEGRPPRKHRHEQRSGHPGTHDRNSELHDGYDNRSQNRPRDRHHEERGAHRSREDPGRAQYSERHREDRGQSRQHRDRGRDGHRDYEDRGHSRHRDEYQSERSHSHDQARGDHHKERSRNRYDERERQQEHERYVQSADHRGYPAEGKIPEHYNPSDRSYPPNEAQMQDIDYYEESGGGILDCHKCRYLCTGRACCQLVEVLLNMLILICCSVSYNTTGGYTGISNLGGIYYYQFGGAYNGFSGADGEKAQTLDVQFYNLKLPTVTASMAFGGALMTFCCLLILLGVLRVPWRWPVWLLVECVLDVVIAVGYIPALYFYFQRLQEAYSSQVCKDREALYSSKGYQGFSCALHGADIAAALFACMAVIVFFISALLAIRGFRTVRQMKKKPVNTFEF